MYAALTASALRTLREAIVLATYEGRDQLIARDLLWALILQESRGGEILQAAGLTPNTLRDMFPHAISDRPHALPEEPAADIDPKHQETPSPDLMHHSLIQVLLSRARREITQFGPPYEIGTEHLLLALLRSDSKTAQLLEPHGINPEQLRIALGGEADLVIPSSVETEIQLAYRVGHETENFDAFRVLDANGNRAREGLRVIEDYVRFHLNDEHLSSRLKQWRHNFSQLMGRLPLPHLLQARETQRDVGTQVRTLQEGQRSSSQAVLVANFKRLEEALRSIEEYGKIISAEFAQEIEQLRYAVYTLEKSVLQTCQARMRLEGRNLYLLVTEALCHHGSGPAVREALQSGVSIVQLREKEMNDRDLLTMGHRMREWTREAGALFIMNDRPDLAVLTDADGVHVGQDELSVMDARRIVGSDRIVGVSTHSIEQARQAVLDGADYIGMGPVYPSGTKSFAEFPGLEFVRQVAAEITLPAFAIGGISLSNLAQVREAGATRVAVSGAICGAANPRQMAYDLKMSLG